MIEKLPICKHLLKLNHKNIILWNSPPWNRSWITSSWIQWQIVAWYLYAPPSPMETCAWTFILYTLRMSLRLFFRQNHGNHHHISRPKRISTLSFHTSYLTFAKIKIIKNPYAKCFHYICNHFMMYLQY